MIPVIVVFHCNCCLFLKIILTNHKIHILLVCKLMVGKGQDIQVNEKLQTFLEVNGQVEDIVRKDLVFPYGKSSGRIGELVSWNLFYCWNHCTRSMLMMKFSTYCKAVENHTFVLGG